MLVMKPTFTMGRLALEKPERIRRAKMASRAVCYSFGTRRNSLLKLSSSHNMFHGASPPQRFTSSFIPVHHRPGVKFGVRAISEAAMDPIDTKKEDEPEKWKIKMLYDGDCPLCMREVNMLQERNKLYGTIKFVDISSESYAPEENMGLDYKTVMGNIHAILSDGTVVTDVEAFRKLYEQVGLGWVYAITKYEPIATIASAVYGVWAKYRLQITGRPPLEEVLELRKKNKGQVCKDNTDCELPR